MTNIQRQKEVGLGLVVVGIMAGWLWSLAPQKAGAGRAAARTRLPTSPSRLARGVTPATLTTRPTGGRPNTHAGQTGAKPAVGKTGGGLWAVLKQTVTDWMDDKAPKLAAALALYAMLSIGPLMVIVLKIVGAFFGDEAAQGKVAAVLKGFAPPQAAEFAQEAAAKAGQPGQGVLATVLATCLLLFTATGVFGELQDSLNTIWEVKAKPNQGVWGFIRNRLLSVGMVLSVAFLFMVSTIGTTILTTLGNNLAGGNAAVAFVLGTVLSVAVMTGLFALIFKVLPDVKMQWRDVLIGAAITAVLFEIGKQGLSWYLSRGSTTSVYGAAGSLAVLLLYIYYSAQILFFGAEFTQAFARDHGSGIQPSAHAMPTTDQDRANQGLEPGMRGVK